MSRARRRVLVCGSRRYPDLSQVTDFVEAMDPETVIITGMASGPDAVADTIGRRRGMFVVRVPYPGGRHFGKAGGSLRNQVMVDIADEVVAFWDGVSAGTRSTIEETRRVGKPCRVHLPSQPQASSPTP